MTSPRELIFDTTCLSHFARAGRLDVLNDLVVGYRSSTTQVVREELRQGAATYPMIGDVLEQEGLEVIRLDALDELASFVEWTRRLGARQRNLGESSVCAAAELRASIAVIDDADAKRVARRYGVEAHGTLWLLTSACRSGKLTEVAAGSIVDSLWATEMRLPCTGPEFGGWARGNGLL